MKDMLDKIKQIEEKYNELLGTVAKLFNDDYKAFRDFITSDETIKAIVEALKFRVVEGKLSPDQSVSVKIEEVANDEILSKVFEKNGISSVDELVVGKTYKILGVHKFGESFITIKSYSVTITNISSEIIFYKSKHNITFISVIMSFYISNKNICIFVRLSN